nr:MAG TPA_asm: hypothetical protein [Caudoviricetes sp.]
MIYVNTYRGNPYLNNIILLIEVRLKIIKSDCRKTKVGL